MRPAFASGVAISGRSCSLGPRPVNPSLFTRTPKQPRSRLGCCCGSRPLLGSRYRLDSLRLGRRAPALTSALAFVRLPPGPLHLLVAPARWGTCSAPPWFLPID